VPLRPVQLVLQYDGSGFSGWQRQEEGRGRTVQGVLEEAAARLFQQPVTVRGAGRTDAGVHAIGQAADLLAPARWSVPELQRALNAVLPADVRVSAAYEMRSGFSARRHAVSRCYSYWVVPGTKVESPFRRRSEWAVRWPLDVRVLRGCAEAIVGNHSFRSFAVRGTAPPTDDHRCTVTRAVWRERPGGLVFEIDANRFLHHMVRFLVGTMVEFAAARREGESWDEVMAAEDNSRAAAPAPAHALFLERVEYPPEAYAAPHAATN
jgi:tRNA pseudouridine38-40 synthase